PPKRPASPTSNFRSATPTGTPSPTPAARSRAISSPRPARPRSSCRSRPSSGAPSTTSGAGSATTRRKSSCRRALASCSNGRVERSGRKWRGRPAFLHRSAGRTVRNPTFLFFLFRFAAEPVGAEADVGELAALGALAHVLGELLGVHRLDRALLAPDARDDERFAVGGEDGGELLA